MNISEITKLIIHKLELQNFRNYNSLSFEPSAGATLIYGPNGIGKTNILEAISLLVPGRGLRNAKLVEMANNEHPSSWKISANISGQFGKSEIDIQHMIDPKTGSSKKVMLLDGVPLKTQNKISQEVSVVWLTPQMDQIFLEGSSDRRKFFDNIVSSFSPDHSNALTKHEYFTRERLSILKRGNYDNKWLSIIERKMAEYSVIIAEARQKFCEYMNNIIADMEYDFPKALLSFEGEIEKKLAHMSALKLEDEICDLLKHNRNIDSLSGRTNAGIHRSDLLVYYRANNVNAKYCSTGEQKSLLISIFLGEVLAHIKWYNRVPILLLDDIMSHLDQSKREAIFDIISKLGAQTIITAVDADLADNISMPLEVRTILNGQLKS